MSTLKRAFVRRTWPSFLTFQIKKPKTQKVRWLENPSVVCKHSKSCSPNPRLFQMIPFQSWNRRPMAICHSSQPLAIPAWYLKSRKYSLWRRPQSCCQESNPHLPRFLSRFWISLHRTWKTPYIFERWQNWGNQGVLTTSHPNIP